MGRMNLCHFLAWSLKKMMMEHPILPTACLAVNKVNGGQKHKFYSYKSDIPDDGCELFKNLSKDLKA